MSHAVSLLHTSQLDDETLAAVRQLLDASYDGEFSDEDWDHTLGGIERTPDEDGGILLLSTTALDLDGSLACDWRSGDVW